MRRREAVLALVAAALVVSALLTVFAIELSNTQAKSKQDVEARVHERGVLAAALIDSLFQSVEQAAQQDGRIYGARTVSAKTMARAQGRNLYAALLDANGNVVAHSTGFIGQASTGVASSGVLSHIDPAHPFGLGNLVPYRSEGAINFAFAFRTPYGTRTLLTGSSPRELSAFFTGDLREIPGVTGAHNYVIDGGGTVLASTNPAKPFGYVFREPGQVRALGKSSGDRKGYYYDEVRLPNSAWRIVLAAPNGPLFATVSGLRKWIPWAIFAAFAAFALAALMLGRRVLRSADRVREANARLASVNAELETTNATLERRARELARSNAELEQFASIASHDLQEPLRKVRTFTQQVTVSEADRLSDKGRDYLERANSAAERMQKLIEDLLKFSRVATHGRPFAPVDLARVTHEVIDDLEAQVEQSGAVINLGDLPTISADALQMRQLMQNLISNAIKFRREGVAPEISIDGVVANDEMRLTVRDNGIGFEPQYSRRIFRVFERLHGRGEYPGTGIGLALCRKIAERHGGTVVAEAELGEGATFTVTMPLRHRDDELPAVAATSDAPAPVVSQGGDHDEGDGGDRREAAHVTV